MRYGIFGDAHSNLEASLAVIEDAEEQKLDKWFFLGDMVGYYANPNEVMDLFYEIVLERHILIGNHDREVVHILNYKEEHNNQTPRIEHFNPFAEDAVRWNARQISEKNVARLKNLLDSNRYSINQKDTSKNLTFAHSTPISPDLMRYIRDKGDASHMFFHTEASNNTIAFVGHTHKPQVYLKKENKVMPISQKELKGNSLIDLSNLDSALIVIPSIGQPRDENPDAGYAIYDSEKKILEFRRMPYNIKGTQRKVMEAGLSEALADRLQIGV